MSSIRRIFAGIAAIVAITAPSAIAQDSLAVEAYHSGETVHFELRVEGPDATLFKNGNCTLHLKGAPRPDQSTYAQGLGANGTFTDSKLSLEFRVTDFAATGDYFISDCHIDDGTVYFNYDESDLGHTPVAHIDNNRRYEKPKLIITKKP
jgi:hypothetical protein